jgi:hypothetical protein
MENLQASFVILPWYLRLLILYVACAACWAVYKAHKDQNESTAVAIGYVLLIVFEPIVSLWNWIRSTYVTKV